MDKGKYNLGFFFGKILASFLISHIIYVIIKYFILSEKDIVNIKKCQHMKKQVKKLIKINDA